MWALRERADGEVVGRCGFLAYGPERRPEYAVLLGAAHQGRGLGAEATRAALGYAFVDRGWEEVVALVRPGNEAARALLRRAGGEPEGAAAVPGGRAELWRVTPERFAAAPAGGAGALVVDPSALG